MWPQAIPDVMRIHPLGKMYVSKIFYQQSNKTSKIENALSHKFPC